MFYVLKQSYIEVTLILIKLINLVNVVNLNKLIEMVLIEKMSSLKVQIGQFFF